jgi:Flp pilus assembly protein protease CpaA
MTSYVSYAPLVIVSAACVVAAIFDVWKFLVPNRLTFPLLLTGLVFHLVTGGISGLGVSLVGALCGFAVLIGVHAAGGMGAGDVKFGAAVGAWLGAALTYQVLIAAFLVQGAYALVAIVILRGEPLRNLYRRRKAAKDPNANANAKATATVAGRLQRSDRRLWLVPTGAMIAAGLVVVLIRS